MRKQQRNFTNEFKTAAVKYVKEHPELNQETAAKNLGVGLSTLKGWIRKSKENKDSQVVTVWTGNYQSEEAKELSRSN